MPLQYKLEHVINRLTEGCESERRILSSLTGIKLSEQDACRAWTRVLDHKWYVSERMGRDVGLRVAAIDYFENIEPVREQHKAKRGMRRGTLPPRLRMMQSLNAGN